MDVTNVQKTACRYRQAGQAYNACYFAAPPELQKMLVGVAPQTRHFWTKCPEVMAASPALSRLFLIPTGDLTVHALASNVTL